MHIIVIVLSCYLNEVHVIDFLSIKSRFKNSSSLSWESQFHDVGFLIDFSIEGCFLSVSTLSHNVEKRDFRQDWGS